MQFPAVLDDEREVILEMQFPAELDDERGVILDWQFPALLANVYKVIGPAVASLTGEQHEDILDWQFPAELDDESEVILDMQLPAVLDSGHKVIGTADASRADEQHIGPAVAGEQREQDMEALTTESQEHDKIKELFDNRKTNISHSDGLANDEEGKDSSSFHEDAHEQQSSDDGEDQGEDIRAEAKRRKHAVAEFALATLGNGSNDDV